MQLVMVYPTYEHLKRSLRTEWVVSPGATVKLADTIVEFADGSTVHLKVVGQVQDLDRLRGMRPDAFLTHGSFMDHHLRYRNSDVVEAWADFSILKVRL